MLLRLDIENIAIIKKSALTFGSGLTVFTGQTGAGKSILLDALSLCLGARADTDLIRHGEDKAIISAVFDIDQRASIYELLIEHGIPTDSTELVIRRILVKDGNSRCFLNDYPVSLNLVKLVANQLMEIHQQFDRMLDASAHCSVLDEYAHNSALLSETKKAFHAWKTAERTLEEQRSKIAEGLREKEFLEHKVKELSTFDPKLNEEQTLTEQRTFMKQKKSIIDTYNMVADVFSGDSRNMILQTYKSLSKLEDPTSISLSESIDHILSEITDISEKAQDYLNALDVSWSLQDIEDRLFELRHLARKYTCLPDELLTTLTDATALLTEISTSSLDIKQLENSAKTAKDSFITCANQLSNQRKLKATELSQHILSELPPLKLGQANFEISITPLSEITWNSTGIDNVEFLVDMNQQGIVLPLNKVASGGEMARLMLALKVCLARSGSTPGLVFDEVDSGVGGDVANAVGQRLRRLSQHLQVLVITHSPQVASAGDTHWIIEKSMQTTGVETKAILLTHDQRINEIARMMAGDHITAEAKAAAAVLLQQRN